MKDNSLEELLDDLCFYSDISDEHYKIQDELLRRFESLEKELKAVKIAHAVAEDIMHTNFNLCKSSAEHWKMMVKDLMCCGNCTYESSGQCFVDSDDDIINKTCGNLRCESWESDLMTKSERWISREEREGK